MSGMVSLVGAGPGDPGLITEKGRARLGSADIIVYDRLASPALLAHASPDAELIDAGKGPGHPGLGQEAINELLVAEAREGRRVVRLKGGDPFVFGRGGEEALACAEAGVAFEVVPGVSSSVAAPSYAGIPVTHRGIAASVTIVTGHEDPAKPSETGDASVDWEHLAQAGGTLVLMMSVAALSEICGRLAEAGLDAATPVAAIERGTLPGQRVVEATLQTIEAEAARMGLRAPSVVVIGGVASLRSRIAWAESRPLWGRRVLVTRARHQAAELVAMLEEMGAEALAVPMIEIEPCGGPELGAALARLAAADAGWVCFTSPNGVRLTFEALATRGLDARAFGGLRVAAIGPGTADALGVNGIRADLLPREFVAESLVEAFPEAHDAETVILLRAEEARSVLSDGLREKGYEVDEVTVYRTRQATHSDVVLAGIADEIRAGRIDAVAFTSSSTVAAYAAQFAALTGGEGAGGGPPVPAVVACIGPVTAAAARSAGIEPTVVASEHSIGGLVGAVVREFEGV